jgi:hypothetical protein
MPATARTPATEGPKATAGTPTTFLTAAGTPIAQYGRDMWKFVKSRQSSEKFVKKVTMLC